MLYVHVYFPNALLASTPWQPLLLYHCFDETGSQLQNFAVEVNIEKNSQTFTSPWKLYGISGKALILTMPTKAKCL